jgi:26S proteasome regulatory subunit N2
LLVEQFRKLPDPDYGKVCLGLQNLGRASEVASVLSTLCRGREIDALKAYQIAFDIQETENQGFVLKVVAALPGLSEPSSGESTTETSTQNPGIHIVLLYALYLES